MMGFLDRILGKTATSPKAEAGSFPVGILAAPPFDGATWLFGDGEVNIAQALRNPSVFRCVTLISSTIGMLPLHLIDTETKEKAKDHPLFTLLHREPNGWQTAYEFRSLMQMRVLTHGNAYARIVWSGVGRARKPIRLLPLDPTRVTVSMADDALRYEYRSEKGTTTAIASEDMLHLRGFTMDGISGISMLRQARDAIRLAIDADLALRRLFQNGSFIGGTLETPNELSTEAYQRLVGSWNEQYTGAGNAGKTPLLEAGTTFKVQGVSAKDAQSDELRRRQVEEIARVFGVPRPLLMVDETSWGSGIEALGRFFVTFALDPWFEAWQQAIERSLLIGSEKGRYAAKFNPAALLRGSVKEQGDYLAKALGAGGHQPWMHVDEAREIMDLPKREAPPHPMMGPNIANGTEMKTVDALAKQIDRTEDEGLSGVHPVRAMERFLVARCGYTRAEARAQIGRIRRPSL